MLSSTISILIILCVTILLIFEIIPPFASVLGGCMALAFAGIIGWDDAFSGFSAPVTLLVIGMNLVALAFEHTGAAGDFGRIILRFAGKSQRIFTVSACVITILLSSIMSNVMVMAIMLPIASSACRASGGKLKKKYSYMAIGISSCMGGCMTLIGAPQNMLASNALITAGEQGLSFFSYTPFGLVRSILCVLFFATVGDWMQRKYFTFEENESDEAEAVRSGEKNLQYWISLILMVMMVAGLVSGIYPVQTVAMGCGLLAVITGCLPVKKAFEKLPWGLIWLMAGATGLGVGIVKSGAGEAIANALIRVMGEHPSQMSVLIAFTLLAFVLSNMIETTVLVSVICPIAVALFRQLGYPPASVALAVCTATTFSCVLPYGTPPITMTLAGGYRTSDYMRVGGLFALIGVVTQILSYGFIFKLWM